MMSSLLDFGNENDDHSLAQLQFRGVKDHDGVDTLAIQIVGQHGCTWKSKSLEHGLPS